VGSICIDAIRTIARSGLDTYLSIKPPALRFDRGLTAALGRAARTTRMRVHCDSHGPDVAEASHAMEQAMLANLDAASLSTTLPGRWSRSLTDADWAIERGLRVRVVKGQWPDPDDLGRDMSAGYLEVIDRLAGRARLVGVATHDVPLAAEAIARLRARGTPFELELLYGMPMASSLRWAKDERAAVRIYVPFGKGFIPSAVGVLRRNPRLAWLMLKDLVS
jgi:proline dehydrogenase